MRFAFPRLSVLLLALLPVVWGNCPYWFVGAPASARSAGASARSAGAAPRAAPTCPFCREKAEQSPSSRRPTSPLDSGDCPMMVARHGSAPAPTPVAVPTADDGGTFFAPVALSIAFDAGLELASIRAAAGPPAGPPGSTVSKLLDEVSLRI